jgi:hypothetical protein
MSGSWLPEPLVSIMLHHSSCHDSFHKCALYCLPVTLLTVGLYGMYLLNEGAFGFGYGKFVSAQR